MKLVIISILSLLLLFTSSVFAADPSSSANTFNSRSFSFDYGASAWERQLSDAVGGSFVSLRGNRSGTSVEVGTQLNPIIVNLQQTLSPPIQRDRLYGTFNTPIGSVGDALKVFPIPNPDPCMTGKKLDAPISQTASTKIISGLPGQAIYICAVRVIAGAAEIVSEWEGTGSACGTGTIARSGSTTAANGESLAANGGFVTGNGTTTVTTTKPGNDYCIGQSGSNRVSGKVTYVYAAP